jgi:predicted extracellular nuclease
MKKILLSVLTLAASQAANAQCTDLFISEYVEGSGNDKSIEFYNPTANAIDLDAGDYELQRWSNGNNDAASGGATKLTGTVQPYSTFVLVNGQTTVENGGSSPAVSPTLQTKADQLDHAYPAPTYFNGNDALVLLKSNNTVVVDFFGKPGEDPGVAWSDANNRWWTKDHTLIRKASVRSGVTQMPAQFVVEMEYDSLPKNTWDRLGAHACECDPNYVNSINEVTPQVNVNLFPNPVTGKQLFVNADQAIISVKVIAITGAIVLQNTIENTKKIIIDLTQIGSGLYFVEVRTNNGGVNSQKVIIK